MKKLFENWNRYLNEQYPGEEEQGPKLSFEDGLVHLETGDGQWALEVDDFLNMKPTEWDPEQIEIELPHMSGKTVEIPKDVFNAAKEKLQGA